MWEGCWESACGGGAGSRELPLGSTSGGDGPAPDKEKPESEGLSWRNL